MKTLQEIIDKSKRIVFFGGAGVSTGSGIPDFRSSNGIYRQRYGGNPPEVILSDLFLALHPEMFFDFYKNMMIYPDAQPNAAHKKLYELEKADKLTGIVTQNIDGLHRRAGNKRLYELHGTVEVNYCTECNKNYSLQWMMDSPGIPRCPECGGMVRPDVVLYGEPLNKYVMIGAKREIANCDTLIVAGTSLTVEPAASMISGFYGKELVVINKTATRADEEATLVIHDDVAAVLGEINVKPKE